MSDHHEHLPYKARMLFPEFRLRAYLKTINACDEKIERDNKKIDELRRKLERAKRMSLRDLAADKEFKSMYKEHYKSVFSDKVNVKENSDELWAFAQAVRELVHYKLDGKAVRDEGAFIKNRKKLCLRDLHKIKLKKIDRNVLIAEHAAPESLRNVAFRDDLYIHDDGDLIVMRLETWNSESRSWVVRFWMVDEAALAAELLIAHRHEWNDAVYGKITEAIKQRERFKKSGISQNKVEGIARMLEAPADDKVRIVCVKGNKLKVVAH